MYSIIKDDPLWNFNPFPCHEVKCWKTIKKSLRYSLHESNSPLCSSIYVLTHKVVLSKHIEVKEKNPICLFLLWWWQRLSSAIWKRPATPAAKVSFYRTFWYLSSSVSSSALLSRFFGSWEQKAAASFRSFFVSLATHQKDKRRRKPCDFLQPPLQKVSHHVC